MKFLFLSTHLYVPTLDPIRLLQVEGFPSDNEQVASAHWKELKPSIYVSRHHKLRLSYSANQKPNTHQLMLLPCPEYKSKDVIRDKRFVIAGKVDWRTVLG